MRISYTIALAIMVGLIVSSGETMSGEKGEIDLTGLAYVAELPVGFEEAIEHVTAALEAEEFGVVSRIDLHASFKKKLGVDTKPHAILKVCNPKLAHQAVTALPEVALLLPCSVTIQSVRENLTVVRIGNPQTFMSGVGVDANPVVKKVGGDADAHLRRVAEALRTSTAE